MQVNCKTVFFCGFFRLPIANIIVLTHNFLWMEAKKTVVLVVNMFNYI